MQIFAVTIVATAAVTVAARPRVSFFLHRMNIFTIAVTTERM